MKNLSRLSLTSEEIQESQRAKNNSNLRAIYEFEIEAIVGSSPEDALCWWDKLSKADKTPEQNTLRWMIRQILDIEAQTKQQASLQGDYIVQVGRAFETYKDELAQMEKSDNIFSYSSPKDVMKALELFVEYPSTHYEHPYISKDLVAICATDGESSIELSLGTHLQDHYEDVLMEDYAEYTDGEFDGYSSDCPKLSMLLNPETGDKVIIDHQTNQITNDKGVRLSNEKIDALFNRIHAANTDPTFEYDLEVDIALCKPSLIEKLDPRQVKASIVERNKQAFRFIPKDWLDEKIAKAVVKNDPEDLARLPERLHTPEVITEAFGRQRQKHYSWKEPSPRMMDMYKKFDRTQKEAAEKGFPNISQKELTFG